MRRRSSWPIPCQAASSYADSAGQARCRCSAIPRARWTPEPPVATEFPFATESPADAGAALSVVLASRAGPAAPADPLFSQHVVQAASSYAHSAGQELLSMLRPHADAASTSWEAREDLGQGSNFESFLPVRSRLASAQRWLVAIGQERVQERLCKGPSSVEHWVGAHESCWRAARSLSIVTTDLNLMNLHQTHCITPLCQRTPTPTVGGPHPTDKVSH